MQKIGLAKLDIKTKSSGAMKSSAAANLSNAQRSSGISYGIKAQRSNQSIFNPKMYYSGSTSATRHALNAREIVNIYNGPVKKSNDNEMSAMEKIMMWSMVGASVAQAGVGIAAAIKDMKGNKATTPTDGKGSIVDNNIGKSLQDLKSSSNKIGSDVNKFSADYKNISDSNISSISSKLNALESNEVTLQYTSKIDTNLLKSSDLGLNSDSSLDDIKNASDTIEKNDIANVDKFIETITNLSGEITTNIQSLEGQLLRAQQAESSGQPANPSSAEIQDQINALNKLKAELKGEITNQANKVKENMQTQQNTLKGLQEKKAKNMDETYKKAQEGDKQVEVNNKKMKELKSKIDKEKKSDKKQSLIAQYNAYAQSNRELKKAFEGLKDIKDSNGTSFTPTNVNNASVENYPQDTTTTRTNDNADDMYGRDGQSQAGGAGQRRTPSTIMRAGLASGALAYHDGVYVTAAGEITVTGTRTGNPQYLLNGLDIGLDAARTLIQNVGVDES